MTWFIFVSVCKYYLRKVCPRAFHLDPVLNNFCGSDGSFLGQENSLLKLFTLCLYILHFPLQKCAEPEDNSRTVLHLKSLLFAPSARLFRKNPSSICLYPPIHIHHKISIVATHVGLLDVCIPIKVNSSKGVGTWSSWPVYTSLCVEDHSVLEIFSFLFVNLLH